MKTLFITFLIIFNLGFAQTKNKSLFDTILKNEQALVDAIAIGDKKVWNQHLADSCIISIEDGSTISKQKIIADLNPLPKGYVGKIVIVDPKLQAYGNTVVTSFINDEYLELYNQKIHTQYRQTDTWQKVNGEWKIIAMQLFEIPKNPQPVKLEETVIKQYVGTYELSAEKKCEVLIENGKLYSKKTNKDQLELLAETENVFFKDGDGRIRVLFIKQGASDKFKMIERRAGEDLIWKQVN